MEGNKLISKGRQQCRKDTNYLVENNMPNNNIITTSAIEEFEETEDFGKDDYGFILGPDGDLKSFMMPEHLMKDPPEEVKMILSMFGIDDINELGNGLLH